MNKNKIFRIAMAALLVVLSIAGTSMAYFTDVQEATNVFTAGNVDITLTEAKVAKSATGHIEEVTGGDAGRVNAVDFDYGTTYGGLFPGQSIYKDPTITNVGSETAYVGAIVTIKNNDANANIATVLTQSAITGFITGLTESGKVVNYADIKTGDVTTGYTVYILFNDAVAKTGTAKLFSGIEIPEEWNNAEMANCKGLNIIVKAYATQKAGFTDAEAAIKAAFPTEWTAFTANP